MNGKAFMNLEVLPIVKVPKDFNKSKYINIVLERFKNPYLNDELKRISIDGSYKIKIRLLDTIKDRLSDKNCSFSSFVITCWFKFLFGKDINNNLIEINDPNKKTLLDRYFAVFSKIREFRLQKFDTIEILKNFGPTLFFFL